MLPLHVPASYVYLQAMGREIPGRQESGDHGGALQLPEDGKGR